MKNIVLFLATGALVLGGLGRSQASGIIYTETALVSGSLGANSFNNTQVTFTFSSDTDNVGGSGFFTNTVGTAKIAGIGTTTFTIPVLIFDNQANGAVGIASTKDESILDTFSPVFASYDLTTFLAPVTGTSYIRPDVKFATTAGDLNLTSARDSTFSATSTTSAVPEPASMTTFVIAGLGLAGLMFRARRRKTAC